MMVKIKFTAQGANSIVGGFSPGDRATVGDDFARHLVEEARVAVYDDAPAVKSPVGPPVSADHPTVGARITAAVASLVGRKPKHSKE